jgi:hypothetical protein
VGVGLRTDAAEARALAIVVDEDIDDDLEISCVNSRG